MPVEPFHLCEYIRYEDRGVCVCIYILFVWVICVITSVPFCLFSACEIHVLHPTDVYQINLFLNCHILVDYFSLSEASDYFLFLLYIFVKSSHFNPKEISSLFIYFVFSGATPAAYGSSQTGV